MEWLNGLDWGAVIAQIFISSGLAGGFLTLWFKSKADKQLEQFRSQLQVHYFQHTIGKVRADEHQAAAIKKIWGTLVEARHSITDYNVGLRNLIRNALRSESDLDEDFVDSVVETKLVRALLASKIELAKSSIDMDEDMAEKIRSSITDMGLEARNLMTQVAALFDKALKAQNKQATDGRNKFLDEMHQVLLDHEPDKIDEKMRRLAQLMRERLKVVEPSSLRTGITN